MKTATEHYVTILTFPHYGEHFVPLQCYNGVCKGILMDCKHGNHTIEIERKDI